MPICRKNTVDITMPKDIKQTASTSNKENPEQVNRTDRLAPPVSEMATDKDPTKNDYGTLKESSSFFHVAIFVIMACAILLSLANTGQYFMHQHDGWAGARRSLAAKNYLRYGYFGSKLCPLDNKGLHLKKDGSAKKNEMFWRHPPFTSILLSGVFAIFGESEAAARLMTSALSLLTFIFFWLSLRRHWGDTPTFYALCMLTFMPFYASYTNFVNYELPVLLCMAIMIYCYDKFLNTGKKRFAVCLFIAMFIGAYSDYPMFVWMFFFWLAIAIRSVFVDRSQWRFLLLYVLITFVVLAIILLQLYIWQDSGYVDLYMNRYKMPKKFGESILDVFKKWHYYYGFLGPVIYSFAIFYFIDLLPRIIRRKLTRPDGYLLAVAASGLTYALAVKQGTFIHSYYIIFCAVGIALLSGYGLYRFLVLLRILFREPNSRMVHLLGIAICIFAILWALPVIHLKRTNPPFQFQQNITVKKTKLKYHYELDLKLVSMIGRKTSKPDDQVIFARGFKANRQEFPYYFDRKWKSAKLRRDFERMRKNKIYKRYFVDAGKIPSSEQLYLMENYNFINLNRYFIFDTSRQDFKAIKTMRKEVLERSDFARYFTSMVHGKIQISEDPLVSLDYANKLGKTDSVRHYRKLLAKAGVKPSNLESEAALFNENKLKGRSPKLSGIYTWIDKNSRRFSFGPIKLIGHRIYRRPDGRSELLLAFIPEKRLHQNFVMVYEGMPIINGTNVLRAGKQNAVHPIIPTSAWKPGLIYTIRTEINLDPGEYEINVFLKYRDSIVAFNPKEDKNKFKIQCHYLPDEKEDKHKSSLKDIERWVNRQKGKSLTPKELIKAAKKKPFGKYFNRVDMGDKFSVAACFAEKEEVQKKRKNKNKDKDKHKNKIKYHAKVLLIDRNTQQMKWSFEFSSKTNTNKKKKDRKPKPFKRTVNAFSKTKNNKTNDLFWLKVPTDFNPAMKDFKVRAYTKANERLLDKTSRKNRYTIGRGDFGIHHPFEVVQNLLWDPIFDVD